MPESEALEQQVWKLCLFPTLGHSRMTKITTIMANPNPKIISFQLFSLKHFLLDLIYDVIAISDNP
jgi:hypothetical protein